MIVAGFVGIFLLSGMIQKQPPAAAGELYRFAISA